MKRNQTKIQFLPHTHTQSKVKDGIYLRSSEIIREDTKISLSFEIEYFPFQHASQYYVYERAL